MFISRILLLLLCNLIVLSSCKEEKEPDPSTEYIIYDNGEGLIGAGGGKITLFGDNSEFRSISLDIPAGALKESRIISIEVTPDALSSSPYSLGPLIALKPEGLVFSDSVKFAINLNSTLGSDDIPIIFQYLPKRGYLKYNDTFLNNDNASFYSVIKHFSLWTYTLRHPDLRVSIREDWPVLVDNYPSTPYHNSIDLFTWTKEDIMRAFSQWDVYTNKKFYLSTGENENNIVIQFISEQDAIEYYGADLFDQDKAGPLGEGGSAVSMWHSVLIDHRLILLNDDYTWVLTESIANDAKRIINLNPLEEDIPEGVEVTVLHEIGHLFGLQHNNSANAVMNSTPSNTLFPSALTCADLDAFNSQYSNSCAVSLINIGSINIDVEAGSTIFDIPMIAVRDANGNGVPGVTVMFYNNTDISLGYDKISLTDKNGNAFMTEMHIPDMEGVVDIIAYAYLSSGIESITKSFKITNPIIDNIINTTWDVTIFFNSSTTWHADVTFLPDGTTRYDEPDFPGLYLSYGKWSLISNKIHWDIGPGDSYVFDGTVIGDTMSGTFVYAGAIKTWSAVRR